MDPAAAGNLSSEAAKGVFQEVKRRIRYVTSYKKNVDKFEESHKRLTAKRDSVLPDVPGGAAEMNVQEIEADVQSWCDSVKTKIEEEEKKVKDLEEKAKNKCFIGLCPSIKSRYRLSRKAEEGATAFEELIQQCQFTGPEENDEDEPLTDFEPIESREKVFNDIMEAVKDNSCTSMIGVHGKGGVGKTTLLKEVVRQVKKAKLFDWVIMVAIAENPIILTIQKKCAEVLDIEWRGNIVDMKRAFTSCVWLSKKRFLLVIDDLWAKLDFSEVGIPLGDLDKENRGNKILLASRDHNVLLQCQGMYAQNIFSISLLDDKEAWDLFQKKVEVSIQSISPDLQTVGSEIAKRCGGLPVAISAVARTLRFKDPSAWTDASRQLQRSSSRGLKEISPAAYSAIKLSYNYIEGEKFKQFFVFCNLLSHNTLIQDLLKYTIGLGLLPGGCGYIVEEARATLLTWVSSLKASGLLLNSYNFEHFDIHDNICDVAISIASTESNRLLRLKREDVLKDWPDVEAMKQHSWINLRIGSKTVLPGEVECPQLTFLNITGENCSTKVPPEFFKEMKSLQVLDLTAMELSCFPSSIGLLSTLQTLCLHGSCLGDIAVVGELKALEILSLLDSDIERLPKEIGKLVKLRWLDLSGCTKLKIIPAGLLSRLTKLEELYMRRSFTEWEADGDANQGSNASLDELSSLSHLTTLEVHIRDAKLVRGNFFFFRKLERYKILIGEMWKWTGDYEYSRTLKLDLNSYSSISHLHLGIKMLLEGTEDLYLGKLDGVKIALHEFIGEKGFPNLKNLHIKDDFNIRYIIPGGFAAERNEFLINLRSLKLHCLPVLISFCSGNQRGSASKTQHNCLPLFGEKLNMTSVIQRTWHDRLLEVPCYAQNLTSLTLKGIPNLRCLYSSSMAQCFLTLENLEIVDCENVVEVIFVPEEDTMLQIFPKLGYLLLKDLKKLERFCHGNQLSFSSLKMLRIKNCPSFRTFVFDSIMGNDQAHHIGQEAEENNSKSEIKFPPLFNEKVIFLYPIFSFF
ncbi:Disease resistance protein [Corchorus olitorius]|uniref:Disease resistance protein n=1 Tax=Corchorus olitorius TaxID=93759 RepID=A0A1R3JVY7_9ROSI|nr:Disease resistance protein [Corchorus olitorius]